MDIKEINKRVAEESVFIKNLLTEMDKVIVGQKYMIDRMLIGILANGHLLLEGVPGLAKTLAISTLSNIINTSFHRIQFTPDLLPADLIGTIMYDHENKDFKTKKGPIFANLILADEINRAPAKVQSALLEAMQERQVTIGEETYKLVEPFLVMATQNPIEQEGTYPLPEAQIDRFMLKLKIEYPNKKEERSIIDRMHKEENIIIDKIVNPEQILKAREIVNKIYVDEKIKDYVVDLIFATREPKEHNLEDISNLIEYGASPRASIYLVRAAMAHAFIQGKGFVSPENIKEIGKDVLRHRIILTYEAEAEEITQEDIVTRIFDEVEIP